MTTPIYVIGIGKMGTVRFTTSDEPSGALHVAVSVIVVDASVVGIATVSKAELAGLGVSTAAGSLEVHTTDST